MNSQNIHDTIVNANIDDLCNPHTGDCVSVAVAIKEVFGGEFVCGYQTPVDSTPAHATVDIDGVLFDGGGSTSIEVLYDVSTSGLKKDEIYSSDEHIGRVSDLKKNQLYDKDTKNKVKDALIKSCQ